MPIFLEFQNNFREVQKCVWSKHFRGLKKLMVKNFGTKNFAKLSPSPSTRWAELSFIFNFTDPPPPTHPPPPGKLVKLKNYGLQDLANNLF